MTRCTCHRGLPYSGQPCDYCLSDGPDPDAPVVDTTPDEWDNADD